MSTAPRTERDLINWLVRRVGIVATREFIETFGHYTIPKRSRHLIHRVRQRAVMGVAIRLVKPNAVLTRETAERVAKEVGLTAKEVQFVWSTWRNKGKPQLDSGASTEAATGPEALSR